MIRLLIKKKLLIITFLFSIGVFCGVYTAQAAVPTKSIGFQGQLSNGGSAVNATVAATFEFYDAISGGTLQGSIISKSVNVVNGYFSTSFSEADLVGIDFNQALWVQVTIEGNILAPRSTINTVPFAINSFGLFAYASAPTIGPAGSLYYNTVSNKIFSSDGVSWIDITGGTTTLAVAQNALVVGNASSTNGEVAPGSVGQILVVNASGTPAWSSGLTVLANGNVGIGTASPIDPLHIVSGTNSDIYLGSNTSNAGEHQIGFGFHTLNSHAVAIVGKATGVSGRGFLEFRVANGTDATNAVSADTVMRLRYNEVEILQPITYAQDVLSIGNNYNSGTKAFKFTRSENKAAIWSVPYGDYGRGDIRFTTGYASVATEKTASDATVRIAGSGGLIVGNSYLSEEPADGVMLITNNLGIGTTNPTVPLEVGATGITNLAKIRLNDSTDNQQLIFANGGGDRFIISQGGTVLQFASQGIGASGVGQSFLFQGGTPDTLHQGSLFKLTGAYNNAGQSIDGLLVDITNTSSAATSSLFNLKSNGVSKFIVDVSGNVGIGTTSPTYLLSVAGNNSIAFLPASAQNITTRLYTDSSDNFFIEPGLGNGKSMRLGNQYGNLYLDSSRAQLQSYEDIIFSTWEGSSVERMRINTDGKVGIGTSTPDTNLTVYNPSGAGILSVMGSSGGSLLRVSQGATLDQGTVDFGVKSSKAGLFRSGNSNSFLYYDTATGDTVLNNVFGGSSQLKFAYGGTSKMVMDSSGNLGIGTTSPYAKLSVVGPVVAEYFNATSTTATSTFAGGLSGASSFYVLQNGNVGIGTANPTSGKLQIRTSVDGARATSLYIDGSGSGESTGGSIETNWGQYIYFPYVEATSRPIVLQTGSSGSRFVLGNNGYMYISGSSPGISYSSSDATVTFSQTNGTGGYLKYQAGGKLIFNTFGSGGFQDRMTILGGGGSTAGNVGIGTSSPFAKLSVVGPVVAEYFNATSTTATSTFAGGLSGASSFYVLQNGRVGIGTTTPIFPLDVYASTTSNQTYGYLNSAGEIGTSAGTNAYSIRAQGRILAQEFNAVSDARLKNVQFELDSKLALSLITKLQPVSFTWKTQPDGQPVIGFLAQDVETVIPNAVSKIATDQFPDQRELDYNQVTTVLVGAFKEIAQAVENIGKWFVGGKFNIQDDVCVDDVCLTKDEFKTMLLKSKSEHNTPAPSNNPAVVVPPAEDPAPESEPVPEPTPEPTPEPAPEPEPAPAPVVDTPTE